MNKIDANILQGYSAGHYKRKKCIICHNYFYIASHTRGGRRPCGLRRVNCVTCSRKCSKQHYYDISHRK